LSPFLTIFIGRVEPKLFKQAKVIRILKPGKDGTDASHFRPISLFSFVFKLLERIFRTLQRIQPLIDEVFPVSQAGSRLQRSCPEQVMAFTHRGWTPTQTQNSYGVYRSHCCLRHCLEKSVDVEIHASRPVCKTVEIIEQYAFESFLSSFSWCQE
jgi:hypothetical protein